MHFACVACLALSGVVAVIPASAAPTEVESFFGGMLLLFGARLASGCTSGHGIRSATVVRSALCTAASACLLVAALRS